MLICKYTLLLYVNTRKNCRKKDMNLMNVHLPKMYNIRFTIQLYNSKFTAAAWSLRSPIANPISTTRTAAAAATQLSRPTEPKMHLKKNLICLSHC
jgi:hypothetical protein